MRIALLLPPLILAISAAAYPQGKHWAETPDETVWRERYGNCDHGYFVNLPPGVIGHGARSPESNHGILISANNPGTKTEVTLKETRLLDVYDSNDAGELGSPTGLCRKIRPETGKRVRKNYDSRTSRHQIPRLRCCLYSLSQVIGTLDFGSRAVGRVQNPKGDWTIVLHSHASVHSRILQSRP